MSETKINQCLCGRQPRLVTRGEIFGHGEFGISVQVQCTCGLSGPSVSDYRSYEELVKEDAVDAWNQVIVKILKR